MQEWLSWLPEPMRGVVAAVVVTLGSIGVLLKFADRSADKDIKNGEGPAAGAVLKQSIDDLRATMERTNDLLEGIASSGLNQSENFRQNLVKMDKIEERARKMESSLETIARHTTDIRDDARMVVDRTRRG